MSGRDELVVLALLVLGHGLVALGELAEGSEGVGAELVEDAGDKLSELLVLGLAVDGKGVGGDRGVDCVALAFLPEAIRLLPRGFGVRYVPLGALKWMTLPSSLNMLTSSMAWMG